MKIHGTAKGGAISKKDFGVAFSAATVTPFDDTGLKSYWKFNESSGDVLNQSESDDSIGSGADIAITGATYNQSELPFGYSMLFDGTNDFGEAGSSLSQWNFMHSTTSTYTVCYWIRFVSNAADEFILANIHTNNDGAGQMVARIEDSGKLRHNGTNGTTNVYINNTATSYIANDTDYFMVFTYDQSLASNNATILKNAGNETNATKESVTPLNGNSTYSLQFAKNPSGTTGYGNFYISECSIWSRVLSDDDVAELYNAGDGRAIY